MFSKFWRRIFSLTPQAMFFPVVMFLICCQVSRSLKQQTHPSHVCKIQFDVPLIGNTPFQVQ